MAEDKVVLYILMRSDLVSLNPGKACAQASHAANQMVHSIKYGEYSNSAEYEEILAAWEGDDGYGTCVVLEGYWDVITPILDNLEGQIKGIVTDQTYPLTDGQITHYFPLETCAYVLGYKEQIGFTLAALKLKP